MKRFVTAIGFGLLLVTSPLGSARSQAASPKDEADLAAADKTWGDAFRACDTKTLGAMFADDILIIHGGNAAVDTKANFLGTLGKQPCNVQGMDQRTEKVRVLGNAGYTYGNFALQRGGRFVFLYYTRTWVKENGAWRLYVHHGHEIPVDDKRARKPS